MEKVILLRFNFLIPSLRYIIIIIYFYMCNQDSYYFLSNIQDHFCSLPISVFAQHDNDTAKVNNSF